MFEKKSLGIALESDGTVRAVELTSGFRAVTLSGAWTFQPDGHDIFQSWENGVAKLRESGVGFDNIVLGIPDSMVYRKHLNFPFNSRKRIMQILNSELEGEIPLSVNEVVADFIPGQPVGSGLKVTAIACDKASFSRFLGIIGPETRIRGVQTVAVGLAVASLKAGMKNGVSVYCRPTEAVLIEFRSSRVKAVRRMTLSGGTEEKVQVLAEGIRQQTLDDDKIHLACPDFFEMINTALVHEESLRVVNLCEHAIVAGSSDVKAGPEVYVSTIGLALSGLGTGEALPFDLRQGPFKQETPIAGLKVPILRALALLVVVGLLGLTSLVTSLNHARGEYRELESRLESQFRELFPKSRHQAGQEAGYIKGELDNLKKRMADLSGLEGHGALAILAALSDAIPDDVSLKLEELSYDTKKLRVEGSVSSFDTVDRIKGLLESEAIFTDVQVQNARVGADINKVTFRLQMEVR